MSTLWRMAVVVASALTLGLTFGHVLELPQRLDYDAELWTRLTAPDELYRWYGLVGGPIEVLAALGTVVLAIALRHTWGRWLAVVAAVCHVAALAVWLAVVMPANSDIDGWRRAAIPSDWEDTRNRWEAGHAAGFALLLVGFTALVLGLLRDRRPLPATTAGREARVEERPLERVAVPAGMD